MTKASLPQTAHRAPGSAAQGSVLQRACACGQHSHGAGECAECRKQHEGSLQRAEAGPARDIAPPIVHEVLRSPGQPLDGQTRAAMEPRFGHDFSQVRVHTGPQAAESARAVNAQAYTVGRHIAFGDGQYQPASNVGRRLLAHELAHVVQQRNTSPWYSDRLSIEPAGTRLEAGAETAAHRFSDTSTTGSLRVPTSTAVGPGALLQRRELATGTPVQGHGDWTTADREGNTARWQEANLHNLRAGDSGQYHRVIERRDFYRWFYEYTASRGWETRWALAASIVATGAYELSEMPLVENIATDLGAVNNELQAMMREGNQVIFDDVFPKLRQLLEQGERERPLVGQDALNWDMQVLSEEQQLVQPLYGRMSPQTLKLMDKAARLRLLARIGAWRPLGPNANEVQKGRHNRGGLVPPFSGSNLGSSDDRWRYGMALGNQFSPHGTAYTPGAARPQPRLEYMNGSALARVDVRPHLHQLDAELDNIGMREPGRGGQHGTMSPAVVQSLLFQLTLAEQQEIIRDRNPQGGTYSSLLATAVEMGLPLGDVIRFVVGLHIDLVAQMNFLNGVVGLRWRSVDYSQIQPMIRAFGPQGRQLATPQWRQVFIELCDDTTIVEAVNDLQLDPATRQAWINEERSWF